MKRLATHQKPDADAVVAAHLMERYGSSGEVEIVFVSRGAGLGAFDCAVDVGRIYDISRLFFDHKPPAFPDRNRTCATRLVWEYLRENGADVEIWRELVAVVHEGDARPPRRASPALVESRCHGLHALIKSARARNASDVALYQSARAFLDGLVLKSA